MYIVFTNTDNSCIFIFRTREEEEFFALHGWGFFSFFLKFSYFGGCRWIVNLMCASFCVISRHAAVMVPTAPGLQTAMMWELLLRYSSEWCGALGLYSV